MSVDNLNKKEIISNLANLKNSLDISWNGEASLSFNDSFDDVILGLDDIYSNLDVFDKALSKLDKYMENDVAIANYERLILFEEQHPSKRSETTYYLNGVSKIKVEYVVDVDKVKKLQADRDLLVEENVLLKEEIIGLLASIGNDSLEVDVIDPDFRDHYSDVSADGITYEVDIIGTPNENTTVILLNHGGGGGRFSQLKEYLSNEGLKKENVIIIRYTRDGKPNKSYKLLDEVSSKYNIPIQNCTTAGFSAGGELAVRQMADFVAEHPEVKNPTVFLIDAHKVQDKVKKDQLKSLGDSGALIVSVQRNNGGVHDEINHEEWHDYGIDFLYMTDNQSKEHEDVFPGYFTNGLFNYQIGEGTMPVIPVESNNGEIINAYDDFRVYNPDVEGNWESIDITNKTIEDTYQELGLEYRDVASPITYTPVVEFTK